MGEQEYAEYKLVSLKNHRLHQSLRCVIGATARRTLSVRGTGSARHLCVGHLAFLADADSFKIPR